MQYIKPQHHERLGQAELLVIDEAAAIPLPLVKAMLGPYLVFLCSTVNGCAGCRPCLALLCVLSDNLSVRAAGLAAAVPPLIKAVKFCARLRGIYVKPKTVCGVISGLVCTGMVTQPGSLA